MGTSRRCRFRLLAGRNFGPQDTATSEKVAIISERMARTLFPPGNPIGHHYLIGNPENKNDREVIGIVKDVKFGDLQEDPETLDYIPYTQRTDYLSDFEVRYTGDFSAISSAVQRTIHDVSHTLPITRVTTLDEQVARSITDQRLVAQLSTFFGLLAVFLCCIGIYGLMAYMVARRTNEIGIRMALGAERSTVRWLVMREVLVLVAIGVGIGVPVAWAGQSVDLEYALWHAGHGSDEHGDCCCSDARRCDDGWISSGAAGIAHRADGRFAV